MFSSSVDELITLHEYVMRLCYIIEPCNISSCFGFLFINLPS